MVAGHLQEKNGYYYIVLSYRDPVSKKRKQPWFATGLTVRGNKRAAEKLLAEKRRSFVPPKFIAEMMPSPPASDTAAASLPSLTQAMPPWKMG